MTSFALSIGYGRLDAAQIGYHVMWLKLPPPSELPLLICPSPSLFLFLSENMPLSVSSLLNLHFLLFPNYSDFLI